MSEKYRASELVNGAHILVTSDDAGIFPATSRTAKAKTMVAQIIDMPERYEPTAGRRTRWYLRTDRGNFSVDLTQRITFLTRDEAEAWTRG